MGKMKVVSKMWMEKKCWIIFPHGVSVRVCVAVRSKIQNFLKEVEFREWEHKISGHERNKWLFNFDGFRAYENRTFWEESNVLWACYNMTDLRKSELNSCTLGFTENETKSTDLSERSKTQGI